MMALLRWFVCRCENLVGQISNDGELLQHKAAFQGSLPCLKYLISHGANLQAKDNGLSAPVHMAAYQGHLECIEYLAQSGAFLEEVAHALALVVEKFLTVTNLNCRKTSMAERRFSWQLQRGTFTVLNFFERQRTVQLLHHLRLLSKDLLLHLTISN